MSICVCYVHADLHESICDSIRVPLDDILYGDYWEDDREKGLSSNISAVPQNWNSYTQEQNPPNILDGICHITVLRDLGRSKYVGTAERLATELLENEACKWLYSTDDPDYSLCHYELRIYCLRKMGWGEALRELDKVVIEDLRCS